MNEINPLHEVLSDLSAVVRLFNEIFVEIAPTKKLNAQNYPHKILKSALSDIQLEAIKRLAGFICHADACADELREHNVDYLKLKAVPTPFLLTNDIVDGSTSTDDVQKETTDAILREFLVTELVRAETLEKSVKQLESTLTQKQTEIDRLLKKLENLDSTEKKAALESRMALVEEKIGNVEDGEELCNMYIRKDFGGTLFFGLLTRFNNPFYEVVYEDGDYEDVTKAEIVKLLWSGYVQSDKAAACNRHFKRITKEKEKNRSSSSSSSSSAGVQQDEGVFESTNSSSSSSSSGSLVGSSRRSTARNTSPAATSKSTPSRTTSVPPTSLESLSSGRRASRGRSIESTSSSASRSIKVHHEESENDEEENEVQSNLVNRVVTSDSLLSSGDDIQPLSRLTLSSGQTLSLSSTLTRPQQIVDLDGDSDDSDDEEEGGDIESIKNDDVVVTNDSDEEEEEGSSDNRVLNGIGEGSNQNAVINDVDVPVARRVSTESTVTSSSSSDSSGSPNVLLQSGAKRKLDQTTTTSPAASTASNSVKKASWHASRNGSGSDSDESAVVFIGRNPAPVVIQQQHK